MRSSILISAVLLCNVLCSVPAAAETAYTPVYHPQLETRRAAGPIEIDGDLDDPGWRGIPRADNFAEHNPGDQVRPPVDTEALITYDDENLYVAYVCYDDPAQVRASLSERDDIWSDDYVITAIDTYADQTWAYEIACNPRGAQGDLLLVGQRRRGHELQHGLRQRRADHRRRLAGGDGHPLVEPALPRPRRAGLARRLLAQPPARGAAGSTPGPPTTAT